MLPLWLQLLRPPQIMASVVRGKSYAAPTSAPALAVTQLAFPLSRDHEASPAQDHYRTNNRRHIFLMLGFNTDGQAASLETFPLAAWNGNHKGNKSQNQHHSPNPK